MKIYKYNLAHGQNILEVPGFTGIQSVGRDGRDELALYCRVDTGDIRLHKITIQVIWTGEEFSTEHWAYSDFLGTVRTGNGLVNHVFATDGLNTFDKDERGFKL